MNPSIFISGDNNLTAGRDLELNITLRTPTEEAIHNLQVQGLTLQAQYKELEERLHSIKNFQHNMPVILFCGLSAISIAYFIFEFFPNELSGSVIGISVLFIFLVSLFYPSFSAGLKQDRIDEQRNAIRNEMNKLEIEYSKVVKQISFLDSME